MSRSYTAIGLMSGTSMDGVDAAIIKTDGEQILSFGDSLSFSYEYGFRDRIHKSILGLESLDDLSNELTLRHIEAVNGLLKKANMKPEDIDLIGFHGQTIDHRPAEGVTVQLGNAQMLANDTGIDVIFNFRKKDVDEGGQGAPLVPVFHKALVTDFDVPVAIVNIGGLANVSWIYGDELIAFDTGPGNALIDDWMLLNVGERFDKGGKMAKKGKVNEKALKQLMANKYFKAKPPKSLDRNDFNLDAVDELSIEDGAATLVAFTTSAIEKSQEFFPKQPKKWFIAGGGRKNRAIMADLKKKLGSDVNDIDVLDHNGDMIEAQAFAYLAVRSKENLDYTFPSTTGIKRACSGGELYQKLKS